MRSPQSALKRLEAYSQIFTIRHVWITSGEKLPKKELQLSLTCVSAL